MVVIVAGVVDADVVPHYYHFLLLLRYYHYFYQALESLEAQGPTRCISGSLLVLWPMKPREMLRMDFQTAARVGEVDTDVVNSSTFLNAATRT